MNRNVYTLIVGALALAPLVVSAQEPPVPPAPPEPATPPAAAQVPMSPPPAFVPPMVGPVAPLPPLAPAPADVHIGLIGPMAPMRLMGPTRRPMAPMPSMAPMPPLPPSPPDDLFEPMEMAFAFAPQSRESEQAREAARQARDAARQQARRKSSEDSDYRRGMSYLDRRDFDKAIDAFNRVVENKGDRADGALYWRAYAQNKLNKFDDALTTIAELHKTYPQSRWLEDSKALEVEVRQNKGQPPSPENVSDEDLKLVAINSLMNTDPDRSLPIIEKLLKGSSSPRLKERALFVLAQSRSPKARDLLSQVAKGSSNPDVQLRAIEYLGVNSSKENLQLLGEVYKSSNDTHVKRAILRSFMVAHDRDALLQAARTESNPDLRLEAIRQLGVMGGAAELYANESSYDAKRAIINGLMTSGDATKLFEIAKSEKDPKLRLEAINMLGVMGRSKTGDSLLAMYRQETDSSVKEAIVNALFVQANAPAMIEIARKETDPTLKKHIVSQLAVMHSKEATDYLMELLNK
jgi:tetratricopeptide (TPR) repeat protein